jgi:hypothetical protein
MPITYFLSFIINRALLSYQPQQEFVMMSIRHYEEVKGWISVGQKTFILTKQGLIKKAIEIKDK